MAGKTLRTDIIIGGRADPSFTQLGNAVETLGRQVNQVSRYLIDVGRESTDAYVQYEDAMLDAEVAMRTQYKSASELGKVMNQLETASINWARESRFTTQDVASAISNAAHAGWDLERILNGVPASMKIAQAGSMDLSQSLEYLVDISNAAGIGADELNQLVDYWAYAANRASTDIPGMGEAMQRMGATMQFAKGDMAGLTTMLAVLANNGTKGAEAGTLLRNSWIRLIAPTKAAASAMDMLELSAADLEEIYSESSGLEDAVSLLKEAGFSAYDSNGDLKSFLTIFEELNKATAGMTEEERNSILSAIFPTRTITGALAMLKAASEGWDGLYESILGGTGYADYAAEKMESGLGGTLRHLESVWDALKTRTGGSLADDVSGVATALSNMIDSINGMDDGSFNAIVTGLETIAVAGPSLIVAGGAIKAIAAIAGTGPWGGIALGALAVTAIARGMGEIAEANWEDKFGSLNADKSAISAYLGTIGDEFNTATGKISLYNAEVEKALKEYEGASSSAKSSMITAMLTKTQLTQDDIDQLNGLGRQMQAAILHGIEANYSSAEETVALYAGADARSVANGDGVFSGIMETLTIGYDAAIAEANRLGGDLRRSMTAAFDDGQLTSEEVSNIQSIMSEMNELFAIETAAKNATERAKMLRKAQTLGIDSAAEIVSMAEEQRDAELAAAEEAYWLVYERVNKSGLYMMANGILKSDGTPYTQADLDRELNALMYGEADNPTDGYAGQVAGIKANYDALILDLLTNTIRESELGEAYRILEETAADSIKNGFPGGEWSAYSKNLKTSNVATGWGFRNDMQNALALIGNAYGGIPGLNERATYYAATGDYQTAKLFQNLATQIAIVGQGTTLGVGGMPYAADIKYPMEMDISGDTKQLDQTLQPYLSGKTMPLYIDPQWKPGSPYESAGTAALFSAFGGRLFAEGGRATEPSIFGEVPGMAEWAIPEEHSQRTAELLDAARAASGFTWPELLSRNGGLNAGGRGNYTTIYSPVIHAGDASGVDRVLQEDKKRFDKWWRDKMLQDEMEAYA